MKPAWLLVVLGACGAKSSSPYDYAVGTYIGGGSIMGADNCTYSAGPNVFMPSGELGAPAKGPRFISGAGQIDVKCPNTEYEAEAIVPTGVKITGPNSLTVGAESQRFSATLVAGDRELNGEPTLEWVLSIGCEGHAAFGEVLGAQDTGGRDRTRTLTTTSAGTCQVDVMATTGNSSYPSFQRKAFMDSILVTIK